MLWLVGSINKHIVHDVEGNWIGTFKDEQTAAEVVQPHNRVTNGKCFEELDSQLGVISESIDNRIVTATSGWTNSTKGWGR